MPGLCQCALQQKDCAEGQLACQQNHLLLSDHTMPCCVPPPHRQVVSFKYQVGDKWFLSREDAAASDNQVRGGGEGRGEVWVRRVCLFWGDGERGERAVWGAACVRTGVGCCHIMWAGGGLSHTDQYSVQ